MIFRHFTGKLFLLSSIHARFAEKPHHKGSNVVKDTPRKIVSLIVLSAGKKYRKINDVYFQNVFPVIMKTSQKLFAGSVVKSNY